ncbi:MAG: hypothetical protein V6Z82_03945 [Flavobacteriales bacterium]
MGENPKNKRFSGAPQWIEAVIGLLQLEPSTDKRKKISSGFKPPTGDKKQIPFSGVPSGRKINPAFQPGTKGQKRPRFFRRLPKQCRWNTAQTNTKNRAGLSSGYYSHAEIKTSSRFRLIPFDLQHDRAFLTRIQHRDKKVSYPSKPPHKDKSQKTNPAF